MITLLCEAHEGQANDAKQHGDGIQVVSSIEIPLPAACDLDGSGDGPGDNDTADSALIGPPPLGRPRSMP